MNRKKVLIFPSGNEGALEIYNSLKYNLHFELYGASGKKDYTDYLYPQGMFFYTDKRLYISNPDFQKAFSEFVSEHGIEYIIPTFDDVALRLAEMQSELSAKVIVSPYETAVIASDKRLMYRSVEDENITPAIYDSVDAVSNYPVFVKPAIGCGSRGAHIVNSRQELTDAVNGNDDIVICEYLPGEEITVDCFTDRHRNLLFVGPRVRERIWHGITFRGKTVPLTDEIRNMAESLNNRLHFRGAWFFQAKRDRNGVLKLLEFSVRQSTNSSLYTHAGVNFSALSLFDAMDMAVSVTPNDFVLNQERRLTAGYHAEIQYDTVYIDYDDTITTHGVVNSSMMRLIYQFINKNKRIILITRHETDLYKDMRGMRISPELFDEIIWIRDDSPKADHIKPDGAVFIDNFYRERLIVHDRYHIPVFDVEAAECLIDDSCY